MSFPVMQKALFRIFLNYHQMYFRWEGMNGYYQYGDPWDPSLPKTPLSGPVINYTQNWVIVTPGIGFEIFAGPFDFVLSCAISPLVFCFDEDLHRMRDKQFRGILSLGLFIEPSLDISFSFNKRIALGLSLSYRYIGETRGDFSDEDLAGGTVFLNKNLGGVSYSAFDAGLRFRIVP
jgi:outer membrane protease